MEILESSKNHPKQFTCKCGCTFVADKNKDVRYWKQNNTNYPGYICPECHRFIVDKEAALEEFEIQVRIVEADASEDSIRKANRRGWLRKKEGQQ